MAERQRAPKGSVEGRVLLRLPAELHQYARAAAKRAGKSYAQWLREAVESAVLRQRARMGR